MSGNIKNQKYISNKNLTIRILGIGWFDRRKHLVEGDQCRIQLYISRIACQDVKSSFEESVFGRVPSRKSSLFFLLY